jgi:hypothetical protein
MLELMRLFNRLMEALLNLPLRLGRDLVLLLVFILDLRFWLRLLLASIGMGVVVFLVAYVAPVLWAPFGLAIFGNELDYFDQRSKGIGIYDVTGDFLGIFDPRMESDFNATGKPIEWDDLTAYPDHKTEHVDEVPPQYWSCLQYLEDRNLGRSMVSFSSQFPFVRLGNLYGIDPNGLMRLPANIVLYVLGKGSGGGGSTIAMQLARSYYKTLPSTDESLGDKLMRKTSEWWLAPVIQRKLTQGGDDGELRKWAANHLPLAQRVGGDIYGVGLTSRMVFGKPSKELTTAEQFVLASAVNRPIQVLPSTNPKINERRLINWQHITSRRAQECVNALIGDPVERKQLTIALQTMAVALPDPKLAPDKEAELKLLQANSGVVRNNPVARANHFAPSSRFGARAEMVDVYGADWRQYVARVDLTLNAGDDLRLRDRLTAALAKLNTTYRNSIYKDYTLDVLDTDSKSSKQLPDIIVAAADENGKLVRYFEAGSNAHYYGSTPARDKLTGRYERDREGRAIASLAKMLGAVLIANDGADTVNSLYLDPTAPPSGLETCRRKGTLSRLRRAEVVFACSMSEPLANRLFKLGQSVIRRTVDRFGFNMPYAPTKEQETPPSTAVAFGLVTGSPQKAHQLASVILASLTGRGGQPVGLPSLVAHHSRTTHRNADEVVYPATSDIVPDQVIRPEARGLIGQLLSAPLCYEVDGQRQGTLNSIGKWCARRNPNVKLHFAKTGTQTSDDPDTTIDVWAAGGIQFANGKSYSYVVLIGSGAVSKPLGYKLHSAQLAAPLIDVLVDDLQHQALGNSAVAFADRPQRAAARNPAPARRTP